MGLLSPPSIYQEIPSRTETKDERFDQFAPPDPSRSVQDTEYMALPWSMATSLDFRTGTGGGDGPVFGDRTGL